MIVSDKTVIVTGASGFIGSHLINRLLGLDFKIIAVTRTLKNRENDKLVWIEWDCLDDYLINEFITPMAIIHLSTAYGKNDESYSSLEVANVLLPLQLLELAVKHGINKFINTDSYFGKPEFDYQHMKPYVNTKNSFVKWGELISEKGSLQFFNMRLEHVYGPGDGEGKFIPYIVQSLMNNKAYVECTDGMQKRDFIYVDDVVSAYITILNATLDVKFLEFEVGVGVSITVREFIEKIKNNIPNTKSRVMFGAIPQRYNEIMDSKANTAALKSLGWTPAYDVDSGIFNLLR